MVMLGSALGGAARLWLTDAVTRRFGEHFPWGTLAVNASGSLAIGLCAALMLGEAGAGVATLGWHLAVIGFLGSYTTVSTFSLQTLALARDGAWLRATANAALSLGLCLSGAALGLLLGHALGTPPA
jgi:fluoride exporter